MEKDRPNRQDQLHRLDALPDDRIDTSDIPEASAKAWHHAHRSRLAATASTALAVEELDEALLKALAESRMNPSHNRLNTLID